MGIKTWIFGILYNNRNTFMGVYTILALFGATLEGNQFPLLFAWLILTMTWAYTQLIGADDGPLYQRMLDIGHVGTWAAAVACIVGLGRIILSHESTATYTALERLAGRANTPLFSYMLAVIGLAVAWGLAIKMCHEVVINRVWKREGFRVGLGAVRDKLAARRAKDQALKQQSSQH